MKKRILALGIVVSLAMLEAKAQLAQNTVSPNPVNGYLVKSYQVDSLGYGYDIVDGITNRVVVSQTIIPCVQGIYRFKTDAEAHALGVHAAGLMAKGLFPPTVTFKHLDSLRISLSSVKPTDILR